MSFTELVPWDAHGRVITSGGVNRRGRRLRTEREWTNERRERDWEQSEHEIIEERDREHRENKRKVIEIKKQSGNKQERKR